jgi:predicted secreted protein
MSIITHIVVFTISWWLVLFMVLPFGVQSAEEEGVEREPGTDGGAPHNPRIFRKMLITTAIATVIWLTYWMIVKYDIITLEDVMT